MCMKHFIKIIAIVANSLLLAVPVQGQEGYFSEKEFTRYDTLRGALNPYRTCYDVYFYDLSIKFFPDQKRIKGHNTIHFVAERNFDTLQVDLFSNMEIDSMVHDGRQLSYFRDSNFVFVQFKETIPEKSKQRLKIYYKGKPRIAPKPPWDGGFDWDKDDSGRHWIGVACEGTGASLWWPNKDHLSEEPDSMNITCQVPDELTCVANGDLREKTKLPDGYQAFHWFVENPINNYNVTINIAHYEHFRRFYYSPYTKDSLKLDYYVLDYNLDTAKKHFRQVPGMLECFDKYFGPFPFPEDGYALVETPYWGMEHQGAIAYGNNYKNTALGFDFIILHETGHEWWGNSVSTHDHGEMWIHEAFTTYMEAVYLECRDSYELAVEYLNTQREKIRNKHPVLGPVDVNYTDWPASDMYYKGTWMLHTLRNSINNDSLWFAILRGLTKTYHQTIVNSDSIINYINNRTPRDYTHFFGQYLKHPEPPRFVYKVKKSGGKTTIRYQWKVDVPEYKMPIEVLVDGETHRLVATKKRQKFKIEGGVDDVRVNMDEFYVKAIDENPGDD